MEEVYAEKDLINNPEYIMTWWKKYMVNHGTWGTWFVGIGGKSPCIYSTDRFKTPEELNAWLRETPNIVELLQGSNDPWEAGIIDMFKKVDPTHWPKNDNDMAKFIVKNASWPIEHKDRTARKGRTYNDRLRQDDLDRREVNEESVHVPLLWL